MDPELREQFPLIKEILEDKDSNNAFFTAKECFEEIIEVLAEGNTNDIIFASQNSISNRIKSKESCRYFINMLVMAFEDAINIKNQKNAFLESYATILETLSNKLSHLDESLIELLKCSGVINANVNIPLLIFVVFVLTLLFYGDNSFIRSTKYRNQINDLKSQIQAYEDSAAMYDAKVNELNTDNESLERLVREKYGMKRVNEEVFITDIP